MCRCCSMRCRALVCWSGAPRVATVGIPSAGCCGRPWGRRFASVSRPLHGSCRRAWRPLSSSSRNSIACRRRSSTAWPRRTGCPFLRCASRRRSTRGCGTTCTRASRSCRGTSTGICGRRRGCGVRRGMPRAMCASELAARRLPVNGLVVAASAAGPSRALLATALLLAGCSHDLARSRDILFVAQRPGGTDGTYALHLADLTTRRLIKADSATSRSLPAWSPDTRSIAFIREFDDHSQLYVLDSVGGTPRQLAASLDKFLAWPDWSPDGASILFTAEFPDHRADVYVIHTDGSRLRAVLQDSTNYRCPSWAPDGRRFVVSAYRAGRSAIRSVDVESGAAHALLTSDTTYLDCPQWSPKGDAIVVTIIPGNTDMWKRDPLEPWRSDLGILELKSGQLRLLVGGPGLNNYGHWSRDGHWIVFQSNRHAAPRIDSLPLRDRFRSLEIYIVRPDGSGLRRLTTNGYYDGHPSW